MVDKLRVDIGGADPQHKSAWSPDGSGYGKHSYRHVDPNEINPEEYARSMRGEEQHYGDVREYNCADNEKHEENTATLDWLGRIGTIFKTEAESWKGTWVVTDLQRVKSPRIYVVAISAPDGTRGESETDQNFLKWAWEHQENWKEIPADELGVAVNDKNLFEQVNTKVIRRGKISRTMREDVHTSEKQLCSTQD